LEKTAESKKSSPYDPITPTGAERCGKGLKIVSGKPSMNTK
jgi:hypothetical protein